MVLSIVLFCFLGIVQISSAQNFAAESVLAKGEIYKLAVGKDGIYKIDKALLQQLGYPLSGQGLQNIRLYSGHPNLLPQENQSHRIDDLQEVPLYKNGLADGSFDKDDYILFYGKGPDSWQYHPSTGKFSYHKHWYARTNGYFLKVGAAEGAMVSNLPLPIDNPQAAEISTYSGLYHYENDLENLVHSGREWLGETLKGQEPLEIQMMGDIPAAIAPGIFDISLVSAVPERSAFFIRLGGQELGQLSVEAAQGTAYGHKGREKIAEFSFPAGLISREGQLLEVTHHHNTDDKGYLDYVNLQVPHKLIYRGHSLLFRSPESLQNADSRYTIQEASAQLKVWDVTDPFAPQIMEGSYSGTILSFVASSGELKEFMVFDPAELDKPEVVGKIGNQNIHGLATPGLLIITHSQFKEAAEKLANFRASNDGLSTAVVTTGQVYNEFSSGKQDVSALRDFIRMLYLRDQRLKYVLLFGDASYDYLSDVPDNTNFVPVYPSKDSFHNVHSYASDDFYGFLEAHEGGWEEEGNGGNHTLEVAVGRLPVRSREEAFDIVNKLIHYANKATLGDWRLRTLFVADDGDANKHQHQSDYLASFSEAADTTFTANRLFTDAFPKVRDRFGLSSPAMQEALQQEIERGALVVDFIGHGSETVWTNERILDLTHIEGWENPDRMPLVLTATCAFGRFDDPKRTSGAEQMLLKPSGGAIALLTSTRPVFPNTSFDFSLAFYQAAFKEGAIYSLTLGDLFRQAKNKSIAGTTNRSFSLLGDPSMRLAVPERKVVLERINGSPVQQQLAIDSLHPLQRLRLQGSVHHSGAIDESFDGKLQITVWGDYSAKTTLGYEGEQTIFHYQNRENMLYKGLVSLKKGRFDGEVLLPKMPGTAYSNCKIELYGMHECLPLDAAGYHPIVVGGEAEEAVPDTEAPAIKVWMENREFKNGGMVSSRPLLVAELEDESGILLVNNPAEGIKLLVDGKENSALVVSSYYQGKQDTYKAGKLEYRLGTMEEGEHQLLLAASDTRGNRREVQLSFVVGESHLLSSLPATIYPNPSMGEVNIKLHLNETTARPDFWLYLYGADGKLVKEQKGTLEPGNDGYSILTFDMRIGHLPHGLYFFKLLTKLPEDSTLEQKTGTIVFYR